MQLTFICAILLLARVASTTQHVGNVDIFDESLNIILNSNATSNMTPMTTSNICAPNSRCALRLLMSLAASISRIAYELSLEGDVLMADAQYYLQDIAGRFAVVDWSRPYPLPFMRSVPMCQATKLRAVKGGNCNEFSFCAENGFCMRNCDGCPNDLNDQRSLTFHSQDPMPRIVEKVVGAQSCAASDVDAGGFYTLFLTGFGYTTARQASNGNIQLGHSPTRTEFSRFRLIRATELLPCV